MPIEVLAAIVVEQALGLAVGATTGATIAVVAPKLRARDQENALDTVTPEPRAKTRYTISDRVSDGVQRYGGSWSDLFAEAQCSRGAHLTDTMTLAGLLASVSEAAVISNTPGRVRLRLVHLKGRADRSIFIADAVSTMPGVFQVEVSSHTASVLIRYDPAQYVSLAALLDWIVAG